MLPPVSAEPANWQPSITRELAVPPIPGPPLDPDLWQPNAVEWSFLTKYISSDPVELDRRIRRIQAIAEYEYPCIRGFHFVCLKMLENPAYPEILEIGRRAALSGDPAYFLDLGCCMGTDLRKLLDDGYPSKLLIGGDSRRTYIDQGYELFQDSPATLPITYVIDDMFDIPLDAKVAPLPRAVPPDSSLARQGNLLGLGGLEDLKGRVSCIYLGSMLHLFNEETQFAAAIRLITLLRRPSANGSDRGPKKVIVFGRQQGSERAGMIDDWMGRERYGHSSSSLEAMWKRAFQFTQSSLGIPEPPRWSMQSYLSGHLAGIPGNVRPHSFCQSPIFLPPLPFFYSPSLFCRRSRRIR
ncbi:hypothetical protein DL93DRAFT_2052123 [Clavulina sp. PMI_390]|nr:hypothetical protein DL93DRAFT_2052123 [Clavulina sp. PMI_390]